MSLKHLTVAAGVLALAAARPAAGAEPPDARTLAAQSQTSRLAAFADREDFDFANRGFVATRKDPLIKAADGRTVWDLGAYRFLDGPAPATVNPSLWRQAGLLARQGLFKVRDGVWQVRGFDIANITFVEAAGGWIVVDALTATETAKAAYDLVSDSLGRRPILAVIYTHSHGDHFGGARGLVSQADVDAGRVKIIAPKGFLDAAVSENVIAGVAMSRRAVYQFGVALPKGPEGEVADGIGSSLAIGSESLLPPTIEIERTGQSLTIGGVEMIFQMTPGTEAPAEMNIFFPKLGLFDVAENANVTLHNVLTPRGAVVRDAHVWAQGLSEALRVYAPRSQTLIGSHGWPRFGNQALSRYLEDQRDAYAFTHDQTVRLMNQGLTGDAIAARLQLPADLGAPWYNHGYYGSLSFNSRAVYQRYMGFYDANPVHLEAMAPEEAGRRYVDAIGGRDAVLAKAAAARASGDDAWAAELLNRLVMSNPDDAEARNRLAGCYDQLAYRAENSLWRNMYLSAAQELRGGVQSPPGMGAAGSIDLIRNMPTPLLFDLMAVRLDPAKAVGRTTRLEIRFPDRGETTYVRVKNGVLIHEAGPAPGPVDARISLSRSLFLLIAFQGASPTARAADIAAEGDATALATLVSWLDRPSGRFPIVTPAGRGR